MNKNKLWFVIFIIIILVVAIILMKNLNNRKQTNDKNNKNFSLSDYEKFILEFSSDKILGNVDNETVAKEKAMAIWIEIYGEKVLYNKPLKVKFDKNNNIWLIYGSLPENHAGGVPNILIQKHDGKVLAIWHTK